MVDCTPSKAQGSIACSSKFSALACLQWLSKHLVTYRGVIIFRRMWGLGFRFSPIGYHITRAALGVCKERDGLSPTP